jgi:site-specific DNA recombinase
LQEEQTSDELSQLEARSSRLRQGVARLIDSYAEGLIDKDAFEPRVTRMRERLKQIEEQALQIKDDVSLERELRLILGRLDEFASRVKQGLDQADWSSRREIIRALVKRVEIDQEQVRVIFRVNPPPQAPQLPSEKDAQSLQHCGGVIVPPCGVPASVGANTPFSNTPALSQPLIACFIAVEVCSLFKRASWLMLSKHAFRSVSSTYFALNRMPLKMAPMAS